MSLDRFDTAHDPSVWLASERQPGGYRLVGRRRFSGAALRADGARWRANDFTSPARRTSIISSAAAMRMMTKRSAGAWLPASALRSTWSVLTSQASQRSPVFRWNTPRTTRATHFSRGPPSCSNASVVAVAHTKNDQAETFLLRLLRGAGPRGLSGMHPRSGIVVRPFIDSYRSDVREFLEAGAIEFREDASNADRTIPRNRIRHELLPFLETHFSPGVVDVLDREAAIAREDAEYLDAVAAATADRLMTRASGGVEIPADAVLSQPPAIARRVIRLAQQIVSGGRFVGFDAVDAVLAFAVSKLSGPMDLPGHRVNRRGDVLVLTTSAGRHAPEAPVEFTYLARSAGEGESARGGLHDFCGGQPSSLRPVRG